MHTSINIRWPTANLTSLSFCLSVSLRLSFLEQARADLFDLLSASSPSASPGGGGGPASNAEAANILLSRIDKDCEALLGQS